MDFNPHIWTWPQWSVAVLLFLSLFFGATLHGKPKVNKATREPDKYNFGISVTGVVLWLFLLTAGGFFGGGQ